VTLTGPGSSGNETTVFGNATKAAVIKFQLKYGIIATTTNPYAGLVGPQTRIKLNSLN
jgi:peptidoglycan hydrolase-like protein with peptidoglycan-binding domain